MVSLIEEQKEIKRELRNLKKTIRNSQDKHRKFNILLEQLGKDVSKFFVENKSVQVREVYMQKVRSLMRRYKKEILHQESILNKALPEQERYKMALQKIEQQIAAEKRVTTDYVPMLL